MRRRNVRASQLAVLRKTRPMFGIRYFKAPPTQYVIQYHNGQPVREGAGRSFLYFSPTTTVVMIPVGSVDVPFLFEEVTQDFQEVTVQGQLTYRVVDATRLAGLMDYSVDSRARYRSEDPDKLNERLIQQAQVRAHSFSQGRTLQSLLLASDEMGSYLEKGLKESPVAAMLGVELLSLTVLSIKATPDMAKAMQADTREQLLLRADQAVFARRNTAIELERQIKENELVTERTVEEKRREVRQARMQADVALEQQRADLVDQQVANNRKTSDAQVEVLRATLEAMKSVDWKTLVAASGSGDSRSLVAMAFQQLAENAAKIGRLEISSELLSSLLGKTSESE